MTGTTITMAVDGQRRRSLAPSLRQCEIVRELAGAIVDCISAAKCFHSTMETLRATIRARVYNGAKFSRLSGARQEYLRGYAAALLDALYYSHAEWELYHPAHGWMKDDAVRAAVAVDPTFYATHAQQPEESRGRHVWRGTDRPFWS